MGDEAMAICARNNLSAAAAAAAAAGLYNHNL